MAHEPLIILLEHSSTDAELMELQLRKANVHCALKRFGTKELFIKAVKSHPPDLVIADYSLPRFGAKEVLALSKELIPGVPVIIFTTVLSEDISVEMMQAGAVDVVQKKNYVRLAPAVKRAMELHKAAAKEVQAAQTPSVREETAAAEEAPSGGRSLQNEAHVVLEAVNHIRDLIAVVDLDGRRIYNSPSYKELLEDPQTLYGTDSFVDVHPDDREKVRKVFAETILTGIGRRMEYRLMDKDGIVRFIESHGSVIADPRGRPYRVVIVSRDVTARKLFEEAQHSMTLATAGVTGEDYFRALVRHLSTVFGVRYALVSECLDVQRTRVRALAYWADGNWQAPFSYDVAGTTCERVVRDGAPVFIPANVQDLFPREKALAAMQASSYLGVPLVGTEGKPIGHLFLMDDKPMRDPLQANSVLTACAARASMELRRLREHDGGAVPAKPVHTGESKELDAAAVLSALDDAVLVTNPTLVITSVNPLMEALSGYTAKEMLGKPMPAVLLPDEEPSLVQQLANAVSTGVAAQLSVTIRKRNGDHETVALHAHPLRDAKGVLLGTVAVVRTPAQESAPSVPALRQEEQPATSDEARRLETISTLAGGLAADLNDLLTPISLAAETLAEITDPHQAAETASAIGETVQKGMGLASQIQAFAQESTRPATLLGAAALLQEIEKVCQAAFPPSIRIQVRASHDLWPLAGEPVELHQALLHVGMGAREGMPQGGLLQIAAENLTIDQSYARIYPDAPYGRYVSITVSSSGPAGGSGPGLHAASAIVQGLGGFLTCHADEQGGSVVTMFLPAGSTAVTRRSMLPPLPVAVHQLVLVVDGRRMVLEAMRALLEASGFDVVTATNGPEAVSVFTRHKGSVRAAIIDMTVPFMDWRETVAILEKADPQLRVIITSAREHVEPPRHSLPAPYTPDMLLSTLHSALGSAVLA